MDYQRYIPDSLSPVKVQLSGIPKGYLGTRKTLDHIQRLVRQGAKDFYVRQKAIDILLERSIQPKDYLGEIKALFEWVQGSVRYTRDTYRVEVLHTARRMLELRAGDCDDMTILLGSMLESIGHPIRLVIMGPDPRRPRFFSHIYLEVNYKGRWIPLDTTMPFPMGWAPKAVVKEIVALDRRNMKASSLTGISTAQAERGDWLFGLVVDISHRSIQPGDPRVQRLIAILKQRGIYSRSQRLQRFLEHILSQGLKARKRARVARRLLRILTNYGILSKMSADRVIEQITLVMVQARKQDKARKEKLMRITTARVRKLHREALNQSRRLGLRPFRGTRAVPLLGKKRGFG